MKRTIKILTILAVMMMTAGQAWADAPGPSNIKQGTITGGSVAFYADEACTTSFEGDVAANATVYVKATPEPGKTAIGVTFTVKKSISSDAMQAPGRRSAPEGPGITSDITVNAVTGKPGIYSFTMPAEGNTNVTVSATFAAPAQQQVSYVDGSGASQTVNAYVFDETMRGLSTGFYIVPDGGFTFNYDLTIGSDASLILRDGAALTVNGTIGATGNQSLTIYAQTAMTGQLTVATYACGVILVPHFVAYSGDYATALVAAGTVSNANKTTINGKTLKPLVGNAFTKYVPQDKSGSYTMALPTLPSGASYSFTKADANGVIANHSYDAEQNTLTYITNSGKTSGTTATITVAATGTNNNDDYSFTLNVVVSEYTTAYAWDPQTNIYLIGNDWAFCDRDEVEKPYHDNELVWSADGVTLNTAKIAVNGGTPSSVTYKVDGTVLTAGENTLVLAPGVHRLEITGDDGKLDDWVDFKVIKLIENDPNFVFTVTENPVRFAAPEEAEDQGLRVSPGSGLIAECKPKVKVTYNGTDVTNSENTTLWHRSNGFTYDDEALYNNDTYRTQARGITGYQSTYTLDNGQYSANMHVYNVSGSTSLDGVSRLDVVCGQLLWHHEGETINKKVDLDGVAVSSGVDGGYVYYVGINCPDFYLKDDGKVYYEDETGEQLEEANKTYTDGKDIFYAGGEAIFQYDNFICFGQYSFYLNDTNPAPLCESYKILSDIIGDCHCPKDGDGNCTSCFSQNGNTLTVCGETIEMGPYIVVGDNFILTGNRAIYNIVPSETQTTSPALFSTTIDGSTITFCGYSIDAGNRPIIKGNFWLYPLHLGKGIYIPSAYARYETEPYCYMIARSDFDVEVRRSVVSINDCKSEYKAGEDVEFTIKTCSYKYPEDKDIYKGSTGDIIVYLNNKFYETISHGGNPSHNVNLDELPAGTYQVHVVLAGDEGYQGAEATATFTVVRNDSEVTLTGKQNTAGAAFKTGDEIEYDPENPIVVNAVNDVPVSGTSWKWQISNSSDAGVVELGQTVNNSGNNAKNSEDINLKTIGLGTVKLWAGFSGNEKYNPATEAITFNVVPKPVTSPIIKLVSDETIYYDGQVKEPEVKVYYAEGKEVPDDQYTVTYQNNTDASTESSKAKIIVNSVDGALYTITNAEKEFYIQETAVTITELPTASIISDGKTLAASTLTGGKAKAGELEVEGTFAWKDATVAPTTDDSNVTEFDVTFTPDNRNYKLGECQVTLTVMPRAMLFADNTANLWATFCGEHEYEVPEGCTAYTISGISGSTVTISEITADEQDALVIMPAYTPVLIQRGENVTTPVKATFIAIGTVPASGYNAQTGLAWSEGSGFTFYGNTTDNGIAANAASCNTEGGFIYEGYNDSGIKSYVLRSGQFILVDQNQGLAAHRCLLNVSTGGMSAYQAPKKLTISKDDITGVKEVKEVREVKDDSWYTLDGRKLNGKPTKKGIYVNGGRKVVVK